MIRPGRGTYFLFAGTTVAGIVLLLLAAWVFRAHWAAYAIAGILAISFWGVQWMLDRARGASGRRAEASNGQAHLQAIFDSTSDAIYVKDTSGRLVTVNRAAIELAGWKAEEFVAATDLDLFQPDSAKKMRFHELGVMQSGESLAFEMPLLRPKGETRLCRVALSPFKVDGRVAGVVGVLHDITEQKRAELAIRASEARYRALLEAAPDAVFVVDAGGSIVLMNSQAEAMFGYSRNELIGRSVDVLVPEEIRQKHAENRSKYITDPSLRHMSGPASDVRGRRKDGSLFYVDISLSPAYTDDGMVVTALVRDVTDRKRIQVEMARHDAEMQAAREAGKLKDVFLSSMSHEMKTPLSLIVGNAEMLEDEHPDDPRVRGILEGTWRLMRHIDALLTYSALLSNAVPLYKTDTCLEEVVRDAIAIVSSAFESRKQEVECALDPAAPSLDADPRRLSQIIQALLENASRFSPEGGRIRIEVRGGKDHVDVSVIDNGVGMSEVELSRIWEPFGKARAGDTERTGGLGLGLKIARKLAELHGGRISILSRPGEGTTVTVTLPTGVEKPAAEMAAKAPSREAVGQG